MGGGGISAVVIEWPDVTVILTENKNWDRVRQIAGICGYLSKFPASHIDPGSIVDCFATKVIPNLDKAGKARAYLLAVAKASEGYIFWRGTFYTTDGTKLAGNGPDKF